MIIPPHKQNSLEKNVLDKLKYKPFFLSFVEKYESFFIFLCKKSGGGFDRLAL
jgi:hypothetical protein